MKPEAAKLRVEQLRQWITKNEDYLSVALITSKAEITISMKGISLKAKVTQFPDEI